jgi:nucleoside-diphosphate-sugar epimerase
MRDVTGIGPGGRASHTVQQNCCGRDSARDEKGPRGNGGGVAFGRCGYMKFFITGAGGYIGGSVAARLLEDGHEVVGLTRDAHKASALAAAGITPVITTLDDFATLAREAHSADAVINAADADHADSLRAMIAALEGTGKLLVHTSGSSVVGDDARGDLSSDIVYDEKSTVAVAEHKQARWDINAMVLDASSRGVRSVVICPSLIYGDGAGLNPRSIQVPFLFDQAVAAGRVRVVGKGLNRWSNVHIDDLVGLYELVIEAAPPGSFYYAENGEASFHEIGTAIAHRLGLSDVESWDADTAAQQWGIGRAYYTFGSNSRVRAARAREELGWHPTHTSVLDWIENEMTIDTEAPHDS